METIRDFTDGRSLEDVEDDVLLRSALERQFLIVGEALTQIRRLSPEMAEQIPDLHRIVGFRNHRAHGYFDIDPEITWAAAEHEAPKLLTALKGLLNPHD